MSKNVLTQLMQNALPINLPREIPAHGPEAGFLQFFYSSLDFKLPDLTGSLCLSVSLLLSLLLLVSTTSRCCLNSSGKAKVSRVHYDYDSTNQN